MNSIIKYTNCRRLGLWAVVIALVLRSLIPAGFMPDTTGQGHGLFALTICDGIHHPPHSGGDSSHDRPEVCPFSVGAIYGFDGVATPVITPPVFAIISAEKYVPLSLAQYTVFSNASPRSPPAFS